MTGLHAPSPGFNVDHLLGDLVSYKPLTIVPTNTCCFEANPRLYVNSFISVLVCSLSEKSALLI